MRSSDWSSDVCSSDLYRVVGICYWLSCGVGGCRIRTSIKVRHYVPDAVVSGYSNTGANPWVEVRISEEHTSELQSLMRISYAVFCLKKKNSTTIYHTNSHTN